MCGNERREVVDGEESWTGRMGHCMIFLNLSLRDFAVCYYQSHHSLPKSATQLFAFDGTYLP